MFDQVLGIEFHRDVIVSTPSVKQPQAGEMQIQRCPNLDMALHEQLVKRITARCISITGK